MFFKWNEEKNKLLKEKRGISFDMLVNDGKIIDVVKNNSTNHQNQKKLIVNLNNKIYSIPFVYEGNDYMFLKTAFRESKLDKQYLEVVYEK
jgi:uncharacterized DUF497 family protein